MSRIDKEKMELVGLGLLNQGLKRLGFEAFLGLDIRFGRDLLYFAPFKLVFFRKARTCGKDRCRPVTSLILACASL